MQFFPNKCSFSIKRKTFRKRRRNMKELKPGSPRKSGGDEMKYPGSTVTKWPEFKGGGRG